MYRYACVVCVCVCAGQPSDFLACFRQAAEIATSSCTAPALSGDQRTAKKSVAKGLL